MIYSNYDEVSDVLYLTKDNEKIHTCEESTIDSLTILGFNLNKELIHVRIILAKEFDKNSIYTLKDVPKEFLDAFNNWRIENDL